MLIDVIGAAPRAAAEVIAFRADAETRWMPDQESRRFAIDDADWRYAVRFLCRTAFRQRRSAPECWVFAWADLAPLLTEADE